jgi:hypothetical protein
MSQDLSSQGTEHDGRAADFTTWLIIVLIVVVVSLFVSAMVLTFKA